MRTFIDILNIARENVRKNPSIAEADTMEAALRYVAGLKDEVEEVAVEIKENNSVYLTDELSDIAWDYATLMAVLEHRGLISSVEDVLEHGYKKYAERTPAFLVASSEMWDEIKQKQKKELKKQHAEKYDT
jgi:NTP pyrophosphatase (non-canonical NTP hydrolase)